MEDKIFLNMDDELVENPSGLPQDESQDVAE